MSSITTQSTIIAFGVNLFLTFYVLIKVKGWNRALNRNFAVLSFSFALWNLGVVTNTFSLIYTGVFMIPPAFYTFLVTLLRQFNPRRRTIGIALTSSSTLLILLSFYILNSSQTHSFNYHFLTGLAALESVPVFTWGAIRVGNRARLTRSNRERARLVYVLVGMTAAAIAGIGGVLNTLGLPFESVSAICGLIYTIFITIAIMRHRLFDVGRFAVRLIVILILALVFWLLLGVLGHFYLEDSRLSFLSILVASLVVVVIYEPLKALVEGQTYRVLSPEAGLFLDELDAFAREMNSYIDQAAIIKGLARTLRNSQRILSFAIYTVDEAGQSLILHDGDDIRKPPGSIIPFPELLLETMMQRRGPVSRNQLNVEIRGGLPRFLREERLQLYRVMNRFRASEVFPFILGDNFYGFLSIGLEDPESDLTRNEEDVLNAIARQFAAGLAHARLEEQARTREHLVTLGRLASGLAHEIRNPLATIKASVQYLEPACSSGESQEFFSMITEEVDRLDRFLDRFLNYARPASTTSDSNEYPLDQLLRKIIRNFKTRTSHENDIKISLHIKEEVKEVILPSDLINQTLGNLLSNAVKAVGTSGTIIVSARKMLDPAVLELMVEDSGPGIIESERDLIFEPFFTRHQGGTGLGLAIVRRIVQSLNGEILCTESVLGGAGFVVRIPLENTEDKMADSN